MPENTIAPTASAYTYPLLVKQLLLNSVSHRQIVMHTLSTALSLAAQPAGQRLHREDVYMPITPMFHVPHGGAEDPGHRRRAVSENVLWPLE